MIVGDPLKILSKKVFLKLIVCTLLASLTVGLPLQARACADDCVWGVAPCNATIANAKNPGSPSDDAACCASCYCCHGYATDSSRVTATLIEPISAVSVQAQVVALEGARS